MQPPSALTKSFSPAQGQVSLPQRRHTAASPSCRLVCWRGPLGQSRAMCPGRWQRQHRLLGQSRLSCPNCRRGRRQGGAETHGSAWQAAVL